MKPLDALNVEDLHCFSSSVFSSLNLFTWALSPVRVPLATSIPRLSMFLLLTAYVAVSAVTLITPILGSSGPPSCLPSPRSPTQAFKVGV